MITQHSLTTYLHDYLICNDYQDYAPNGLQVEGRTSINKICSAVSASLDVINKAIELKADALIVHHGYFWKGENPTITGMKYQRLKRLLENNINLYAYHLPLDGHTELGNNACIAKLLNATNISMHTALGSPRLLWDGELMDAITANSFTHQLNQIFLQKPLYLFGNNQLIKKVAWCSGAAQDLLEMAKNLGADAFISGEVSERTYYQAKELEINYFACGHHATERYGVQSLGNYLAQTFNLEHEYIEIDNPI